MADRALQNFVNGKYVDAFADVTNAPLKAQAAMVSTTLTSWEKFSCE